MPYVHIHAQDTADWEWMMWFSTFKAHILFALSGHVLFAKICSMLAPQVILLTSEAAQRGGGRGRGRGADHNLRETRQAEAEKGTAR